jgi:hypothetical protein
MLAVIFAERVGGVASCHRFSYYCDKARKFHLSDLIEQSVNYDAPCRISLKSVMIFCYSCLSIQVPVHNGRIKTHLWSYIELHSWKLSCCPGHQGPCRDPGSQFSLIEQICRSHRRDALVATTELLELCLPSLLSVVSVVGDTHLPEVRRSGERRFNPPGTSTRRSLGAGKRRSNTVLILYQSCIK